MMVEGASLWRRLVPDGLPVERIAAWFGLIADTHMPERCPVLLCHTHQAEKDAILRGLPTPGTNEWDFR